MNREILALVDVISNERGIKKELVFEAVEAALAAVAAKRYEDPVWIRVAIDREDGSYETFRCWLVVPDELEEDMENMPAQQISLSEAKKIDENLDRDDVVEESIESESFGRIGVQQAKQVIMQKVRQAEREKVIETYGKRLGELVTGVVKRVTREHLIIDLGSSAEALLPRDEMIPREAFRMNDRVRALLVETREEQRGPQLLVSRTRPEFLIELFKIEVPEIGEQVIEIKNAARDPGARAKIAVKTNDKRIDPIGACVGMRGSRVQAVSNEMAGERIDIVLWDDNPAQLVINAMAPAEVASIVADEDKKTMDIAVAEDQLSQAIGRGGQNVRLASELTGWTLNVMSEDDANLKHESEVMEASDKLIKQLDIDKTLAELLVQFGFNSAEELAFAPMAELMRIEGLDEATATELQTRASDFMLLQEMSAGEPAADLLEVEGVDEALAGQLAGKGIVTREDLAEQATDELLELDLGLDEESAGKLIMAARAHWFE